MCKKSILLSKANNSLLRINLSQILFIEKIFSSIFEKTSGLIICKPVYMYFKFSPFFLVIKPFCKLKSPLRFLSKLFILSTTN